MATALYNFIAIEGNIGAGKTTLSTLLSKYYDARLILEQFEENPFLPAFYSNPEKVAFPLELSFLADRYNQLKSNLRSYDLFKKLTIADYYIFKSFVFASQTLNEDELQLYRRFFDIIVNQLPGPDLLVYLHTGNEKLQQNIRKRGRTYEQHISDNYLSGISGAYLNLLKQINKMPVLIIDTEEIDFVQNSQHFDALKKIIEMPHPKGISNIGNPLVYLSQNNDK